MTFSCVLAALSRQGTIIISIEAVLVAILLGIMIALAIYLKRIKIGKARCEPKPHVSDESEKQGNVNSLEREMNDSFVGSDKDGIENKDISDAAHD